MMREIYPCLWFDGRAKEAAVFYCSIFPNSRITSESPVVVNWELNGKQFMGLNDRRPKDHFNETISFVITCDNQQEIDHYWNHLTSDGGSENMCGWCRDKFGVSWQVVPAVLGKLMSDPARAPKVIQAFLKMRKFDIEKLMNAWP
ncbi:MAG: VOC family protein [Bacteroidetes bacterium]|nr:VOC family protein [Bacteroidota bacterium]MBS1978253.1 VOC family protein [Bacteroidota bacterium]